MSISKCDLTLDWRQPPWRPDEPAHPDRAMQSLPKIVPIAALTLASGLAAPRAVASPPRPLPVAQHLINEAAAALEQARFTLVDSPGLRAKNEPLAAYVTRTLAVRQGETPAETASRFMDVVRMLDTAAVRTRWARTMPQLADNSYDNRGLWKRITLRLSELPIQVHRLRTDAETIEKLARTSRQKIEVAPAVSAEVTQALLTITEALDALKDALP
ncbi:MAG TPA: hypothetical protein VGS41_18385 [Chthonomonadales bacterium]|nr:hypothetical protein [Chthonomonadales bacterium]